MNNNIYTHIKIFFLMCVFLVFFSCKTKIPDRIVNDNQILSYKNDSIEYVVFENNSKLNSDSISQCGKFLEVENTKNGFEIYGADIADLYSIFYNINKNNIDLRNQTAISYTIIYKGIIDDNVRKDLFQKLLDKRGLIISNKQISNEVNLIEIENSTKLDLFKNSKSDQDIKVLLGNDKYELINVSFVIFSNTLNNLYPNKFIYEGENQKRYNLEIPLGKDEDTMIKYLKEKYDININKTQKTIQTYIISDLIPL